jgi:hypothetical protein
MLLMAKYISMNPAQNGRIPAAANSKYGLADTGEGGMTRAVSLVGLGHVTGCTKEAKKPPMRAIGMEMPNHRAPRKKYTLRGTAPDVPVPWMRRFSRVNRMNVMPAKQAAHVQHLSIGTLSIGSKLCLLFYSVKDFNGNPWYSTPDQSKR